jgi:lambda family phage portal protein
MGKVRLNLKRGLRGAFSVASGRAVAVNRDQLAAKLSEREFKAAKSDGRGMYWYGTKTDAMSDIKAGLDTLRARSRDLYQNSGYGRAIIDTLVDWIVATGVYPTVDTGSDDLDQQAWELWQKWGKVAWAGSKQDIYGLMRLAVKHWMMDGESLIRFRARRPGDMPGLPPLKLQILEPDLLPVTKTEQIGKAGNVIVSGVETDAIGDVVAYHLLKSHPAASIFTTGTMASFETSRVPADNIIHLFEAYRAGQCRGVPAMTPVMMATWDLEGFVEALLVAVRAISCLVGVVEGGEESSTMPGVANDVDDSGDVMKDGDGNTLLELFQPGTVGYLSDGKSIKFTTPQMPSNVKETVAAFLHEIAAGVGLSYYTVSGDMSDSSFAQAKLSLIKESVALEAKRRTVLEPMMLTPIWQRFISDSIASGLLPNNPALYNVRWSSPKIPSADESSEVKTGVMKMQALMESPQHLIESRGGDVDAILKDWKNWTDKLAEYGLVSLGNLAQVNQFGLSQPYGPPVDGLVNGSAATADDITDA